VNLLLKFWHSSIGKKWIVALTGLGLLGFVIAHLAGNLQMFAGPEKINAYAELLHNNEKLLWVARFGLIGLFGLHIFTTIQLVVQNRAARAERYQLNRDVQAKTSTKTMIWSGLTVLGFVVYHLLHYTLRVTDPRFKLTAEGGALTSLNDVYKMVVLGFQTPGISALYIVCVGLLCMHLSHGISSVFITLGIESKKSIQQIGWYARAFAALLFLGYASIPTAVLAGLLK
jgi:succinate dehydrogenase / fumarate reductase cytochrome b subunit